jgi:hypothetical protein
MANADNVFILGRSVRATEEAALSTGLVINESKTKYVNIARNITNFELKMDGEILEWFQTAGCLGDLIMQNINK